jgi:hypothetical protein
MADGVGGNDDLTLSVFPCRLTRLDPIIRADRGRAGNGRDRPSRYVPAR